MPQLLVSSFIQRPQGVEKVKILFPLQAPLITFLGAVTKCRGKGGVREEWFDFGLQFSGRHSIMVVRHCIRNGRRFTSTASAAKNQRASRKLAQPVTSKHPQLTTSSTEDFSNKSYQQGTGCSSTWACADSSYPNHNTLHKSMMFRPLTECLFSNHGQRKLSLKITTMSFLSFACSSYFIPYIKR